MALYEYECSRCRHRQDVWHPMTESPAVVCAKCGAAAAKVFGNFNVALGKTCKEIWDYDIIHEVKPKWLRSKDGKTRVRYDPTKHGSRKGSQSHLSPSKKARRASSESSESSEQN